MQLEMLLEVVPLLLGGFPVFLDGPLGSATVREASVGPDQVVLEDGQWCIRVLELPEYPRLKRLWR
ncbi:hypothetical protein [Streptomyces coelicoflavus]|uniref:hypothetical protein n=1 Tax=Streptomyces coelicoflavus TaxID=285562 RepID=UPI00131EE84F|nr:hypothetical protein [Streptomyces coelicoflavus]